VAVELVDFICPAFTAIDWERTMATVIGRPCAFSQLTNLMWRERATALRALVIPVFKPDVLSTIGTFHPYELVLMATDQALTAGVSFRALQLKSLEFTGGTLRDWVAGFLPFCQLGFHVFEDRLQEFPLLPHLPVERLQSLVKAIKGLLPHGRQQAVKV
jgi:hypothetical protein